MKHWFIIISVAVFTACSKPQKAPYLTLKPDLPISGQAELYYLSDDYTLFDVASGNEDNSNLCFRKDSVPEGIYELRINQERIAHLIISSSMPFSISGNFIPDLSQLTITNNDETKALWKAKSITQQLDHDIRQLATNLPDSLPEKQYAVYKDSLYQQVSHLIESTRNKIDQLKMKHEKSLLSLLLVKLQAGNHLIFHPENNSEDYYEVCNHLKGRYPNYVPVQKFAFQIDSLMSWNVFNSITKPGRKLPAITIPNAWGKQVLIDSLVTKPTLFILWKSSDTASRTITKKLMRWSWLYRSKGLQVCMISLDDNKNDWLTAIKEDRLSLLHLSDLKGINSPMMDQMGLKSVPTLLLVNTDKIIVERTTELELLTESIREIIKN